MNLVNGIESDVISLHDRGWNYGDGAFRTLLLRNGRPHCWPRHYTKLRDDCVRLGIACPPSELFEQDFNFIAERHPDRTIRVVVTRGDMARGYAASLDIQPTRVVVAGAVPAYPAEYHDHGVRAHLCRTTFAIQPLLAGIKHLNRLENVLARSEWSDPGIAEGIVCDTEGNVVSGTMSNLFAAFGAELLTPDVSRSGVAGVQRARVLEFSKSRGIMAKTGVFGIVQLLTADEIFVVNSLIGAWQITSFEGKSWRSGELTPEFRRWLDGDD